MIRRVACFNARIPVDRANSSVRLACLQGSLGSDSWQRISLPARIKLITGRTGMQQPIMEIRRAVRACTVPGHLRQISPVSFIRSWSMTVQSRVKKPAIRHD